MGALAALGDVAAADLVQRPTQTRAAVDARVRVGTAAAVADAIADDQTVIDAAIAAMSDVALQEQLLWTKGNIRSAVTVRDLPPGTYTIGSVGFAEMVTGLPEVYPGTLVVEGNPGQAVKSFRFHPHNATYFYSWQMGTSGTVMPFVKQEAFAKGNINAAVDAFALAPGRYTIGAVSWAEQVANLPEVWPGVLDVIGNAGQITNSIAFYPYSRDYYWMVSRSAGGGWMPWRQVGVGSGSSTSDHSGIANSVRLQDWSRRRGGVKRISTGAVALRFDHGLANFNTKIRPLLEARSLPYALALNSDRWSIAENTGVTASMVNGWVQGGLCEIWNHGRAIIKR